VQGLLILAHHRSGILSVTTGAATVRVISAIGPREKHEALFRFLSLPAATGQTLSVAPGADITLCWAVAQDPAWARWLPGRASRWATRAIARVGGQPPVAHDHGFAAAIPPRHRDARESRIAAILVETF
jgi:hypothetical protein